MIRRSFPSTTSVQPTDQTARTLFRSARVPNPQAAIDNHRLKRPPMPNLRIFSYLPNPRIWKAAIGAGTGRRHPTLVRGGESSK